MGSAPEIASWLIAVICVGAGIHNLSGTETVRQSFTKMGYPPYWHIVTGVLELVGAVLVVIPATRLAGVLLLGAVLAAASVSLVINKEWKPLAPCLLFLATVIYIGVNL
ncbi:DoxX family protein [Actibacterium sp. D379-3]